MVDFATSPRGRRWGRSPMDGVIGLTKGGDPLGVSHHQLPPADIRFCERAVTGGQTKVDRVGCVNHLSPVTTRTIARDDR